MKHIKKYKNFLNNDFESFLSQLEKEKKIINNQHKNKFNQLLKESKDLDIFNIKEQLIDYYYATDGNVEKEIDEILNLIKENNLTFEKFKFIDRSTNSIFQISDKKCIKVGTFIFDEKNLNKQKEQLIGKRFESVGYLENFFREKVGEAFILIMEFYDNSSIIYETKQKIIRSLAVHFGLSHLLFNHNDMDNRKKVFETLKNDKGFKHLNQDLLFKVYGELLIVFDNLIKHKLYHNDLKANQFVLDTNNNLILIDFI